MRDYAPDNNLLKDRIIMVTGAGDGIGKAAALSFARHGASVILLGRTTAKLEKVYDTIEAEGGPTPAILSFNLLSPTPENYQAVYETIAQEFGRLDGLLHNAGDLGNLTPIEQYDAETWYRVMQINVNAAFMLTQCCLPLLKKSADASVVFTSSGVGRKGRAYWGAYAVSKFANEGMMQVLADELEGSTDIRVNSLNPGATHTNMRSKAYPGEDPDTLPEPEDLMPAYLYLLGPDSQGTTGQQLDARDFIKAQ